MQIAIIGAGAAGCFAAIHLAHNLPHARVIVYEAHQKPLAKVAITGGGRCNLTNSFHGVASTEAVYPRGARLMKRLLREFSHQDTYRWFEAHGVPLVTQEDECVFPRSQRAGDIVHTLLDEMKRHGVQLRTSHRVTSIIPATEGGYQLRFAHSDNHFVEVDVVVVTTGGSPRLEGLHMLAPLEPVLETPVPSLFSLCLPSDSITQLMGIVVQEASATIPGTKFRARGPLLITHWGLSGPAILKLSAHAARHLHECNYTSPLCINWCGEKKETEVAEELQEMAHRNPHKQLQSVHPSHLNNRLWTYLLTQAQLRPDQKWAELGRKSINRLAAVLTNQSFSVAGKNRFKEEFVTCGGVTLSYVNPSTLECRQHPGLYFAGEVLDVDAVTGGFNLQAAWTMGYVVAKSIAAKASQ